MGDVYIRKQDAVEKCGEWYVEEVPEEGFIGTVSQMLDMFSPADVVPVVHGEWEYIDDTYCGFEDTDVRCSVCKTITNIKRFRKTKWCPDCGALMDGKREE